MKGSVGLAGLQCRGWQGCLPPEAVGGLFLPLPAPGGPRHPRLTAASPPPLPPWSQGLLLRVSVTAGSLFISSAAVVAAFRARPIIRDRLCGSTLNLVCKISFFPPNQAPLTGARTRTRDILRGSFLSLPHAATVSTTRKYVTEFSITRYFPLFLVPCSAISLFSFLHNKHCRDPLI